MRRNWKGSILSVIIAPYLRGSRTIERTVASGVGAGIGLALAGFCSSKLSMSAQPARVLLLAVMLVFGHAAGSFLSLTLYDRFGGSSTSIIHAIFSRPLKILALVFAGITCTSILSYWHTHSLLDLSTASFAAALAVSLWFAHRRSWWVASVNLVMFALNLYVLILTMSGAVLVITLETLAFAGFALIPRGNRRRADRVQST